LEGAAAEIGGIFFAAVAAGWDEGTLIFCCSTWLSSVRVLALLAGKDVDAA
jgi:hypothetical protein